MEGAAEARQKLLDLREKRKEMEAEMSAVIEYLTGPESGHIGLQGGLIDAEGFPIDDVEKILSVRKARNRLACMRTDYAALNAEIEAGLAHLHRLVQEEGATLPALQPSKNAAASGGSEEEAAPELQLPPIALIDEVALGGPAEEAGVHVGDVLLKIGDKDAGLLNGLLGVAKVVEKSIGSELALVVKRGQSVAHLKLTPKRWSGRGVLGMHLTPL